jgi:hypothetical protein
VVSRKRPGRLSLPEYARARPDKVIVKQALVKGTREALPVYRFQCLPAPLDSRESVPVLLSSDFSMNCCSAFLLTRCVGSVRFLSYRKMRTGLCSLQDAISSDFSAAPCVCPPVGWP